MSTGRFTLPTQENMDDKLLELIRLWGADAMRDSDGTKLSPDLCKHVEKIYGNYFPARQDQEYAKAHPEELQHNYLLTSPSIARGTTHTIELMAEYYDRQFRIDEARDPKIWWEVMDRTTGEVVVDWTYQNGLVTLHSAIPYHAYTVAFYAYQLWDPTHMYNHITNSWGDSVPPSAPYDPAIPATHARMLSFYEAWLKEHEDISVVRFTTFFYHFTLYYSQLAKQKYVDWFGYNQSNSPVLLEGFMAEQGVRPRPEELVDEGYYNNPYRLPTPVFRAYMDYVQRFVCKTAKEIVDLTHRYGKEAMMFLGDNYIGTEPYGEYWSTIGLDAVVGSVGNGATLRMIADIPHVRYTEGRFLPYFFPDTFYEGGEPTRYLNDCWLQARRAMLRHSVDRIGYGGYPELAMKFPDFVQRVAEIADEFRHMMDQTGNTQPYTMKGKVALLNSWGALRTWQCYMVHHDNPYKQTAIYIGVLEALSGLPVDVTFLSFDDIRQNGVPEDVSVVINAGPAYTAYSGGENWADPQVVTKLRAFVDQGGGFIGVGEPTAYQYQGRFFQLSDVLGVEKENCFGLGSTKHKLLDQEDHFITRDLGELDLGELIENVYKDAPDALNLAVRNGCSLITANQYGAGRGVYLAGLPYSPKNARLLLKAIYWAASKEAELTRWYADNPHVECAAYPERGVYALANNTAVPQSTTVYLGDGSSRPVELKPMELQWHSMESK